MNLLQIKARLVLDEGQKPYVYKDTRGFDTIGNGFCIDKRIGEGLPNDVRDFWLTYLVNKNIQTLAVVLPQLNKVDDVRKQLFVCLLYNLGAEHLEGFHRTLEAAVDGNFDEAAAQLQNSAWFTQVGQRGPIYVRILRTGEWE